MKENFFVGGVQARFQKTRPYLGIWVIASYIMIIAVFTSGCTHEDSAMSNTPGNTTALKNAIAATFPADKADTVVVNPVISVTLKSALDTAVLKSASITLQEGTVPVAGTVSFSGTAINFTPSADLKPETKYTATITATSGENKSESGEHSWTFTTGKRRDNNAKLAVVSVTPADGTTDAAIDVHPTITFNKTLTTAITNSLTIKFTQGSATVSGTITYSGTTVTFVPNAPLAANTVYTGTVTIGNKNGNGGDDQNENENGNENENENEDSNGQSSGNSIYFSWSFTTAGSNAPDVTPPTVSSANPANSATGVALSVHPSVTFSEAMKSSTISDATFTLMNGTTPVSGTVSSSGTTATFTPTSNLEANTLYTGKISTGVTDLAGNALASDFTWSFTTSAGTDMTPPTVSSVVPLNNAANVALNAAVKVNFSEAMDPSTISGATFTVKQGTTAVSGTVSYSGNTATFTPSSALNGNTAYTATITTGAKDAAGNALSSDFSWSFTTVAPAPVVSFANQVLPVLQAKCMPCHSGSNPPAGITIKDYTTVSALSNSQIDNPNMYPKMGVTTAEQALIKQWIAEGRPNN